MSSVPRFSICTWNWSLSNVECGSVSIFMQNNNKATNFLETLTANMKAFHQTNLSMSKTKKLKYDRIWLKNDLLFSFHYKRLTLIFQEECKKHINYLSHDITMIFKDGMVHSVERSKLSSKKINYFFQLEEKS